MSLAWHACQTPPCMQMLYQENLLLLICLLDSRSKIQKRVSELLPEKHTRTANSGTMLWVRKMTRSPAYIIHARCLCPPVRMLNTCYRRSDLQSTMDKKSGVSLVEIRVTKHGEQPDQCQMVAVAHLSMLHTRMRGIGSVAHQREQPATPATGSGNRAAPGPGSE
jgi:hypothetical protein